MLSSAPEDGAIVGYARTAKIAAIAPPTEDAEVIKARRMAYYKHMSEGPRPAIAVVEDNDGENAVGAFWGESIRRCTKALGLPARLQTALCATWGIYPKTFR